MSIRNLKQLRDADIVAILANGGEPIVLDTPEGRKLLNERRLMTGLLALGFRPFVTSHVEAYMAKKLEWPNRVLDFADSLREGSFLDTSIGNELRHRYGGSYWRRHSVYNALSMGVHVPKQVRKDAERIQEALPEASVRVHSFKLDPFLGTHLGDGPAEEQAVFYTHVWDELTFRGTRM
jgi:hypothetical protein